MPIVRARRAIENASVIALEKHSSSTRTRKRSTVREPSATGSKFLATTPDTANATYTAITRLSEFLESGRRANRRPPGIVLETAPVLVSRALNTF